MPQEKHRYQTRYLTRYLRSMWVAEKVFLDLGVQGGVTYDRFLGRSAQMAHVLVEMGVVTGDRIVAQVEKAPEMLMLYAACVQGGFVFLPLNPVYTSADTTYFLQDSDAALLVSDKGEAWANLGVS